jgi:PAS domain S-box-containing protein
MTDHPRKPVTRSALQLALGIGAFYALAGVAWILTSDALVTSLSADPVWRALAQRYKGLFYVLATAAGLVVLVRVGFTRLMKANELARANELQVQDLFVRNPVPMWIREPDTGEILQVNPAAIKVYGYSAEDFRSMKVSDLDGPPDATPLDSEPGARRLATKSGEPVFALISEHHVPFEGRHAVMAMALDVTRQALAQRELAVQEAQFRQLHQSLGEVLWIASADGRDILYVSPAFESLYGRPRRDFFEDRGLWLAAVHEDDRAQAIASGERLVQQGASSCEYRICRPDGSIRWVADRKKAIVDGGRVTKIAGIAEDITASKELEIARATTTAELERMVAERTVELERVNAELNAFAHTAAHDLKTPLNGIVGISEILRRRHGAALGDDGLRLARLIAQSAQDMATLVNDLLTLSFASTSALELREVDLVPIVRELVDELRRQDPARHVELDLPPELTVWCDPGLARSLMANLVGNAWKFTGKRSVGRIRLHRAIADEACITVCLEDNGAGFDTAHAQRLFEPFQRFHSAGQFSGTGIGLATCQRIVQRHGGDIAIASAPDQGTVVSFRLASPQAQLQPASKESVAV